MCGTPSERAYLLDLVISEILGYTLEDSEMYALIKNDHGGYYGSTVFGYYTWGTATDDYERYLERMFSQYYVVLNEEKDRLINCYVYQSENKFITKNILISS